MVDWVRLEAVVQELLTIYEVSAPPIPVEMILQSPRDGMWDELDITQISGSFLQVGVGYSVRMPMARVLARHITRSEWGITRSVNQLVADEPTLHAFARILVMPAQMVMELKEDARTPDLLAAHFEVPVDDARLRLQDLQAYSA